VFQVAIADRNGVLVDSHPAAVAADVAHEPYFTVHQDEDGAEPFVSRTRSDPSSPEPHLRFTRRINDAYGRFAGIAIVEVDPAYFTSSYDRAREGELGLLALVGDDGVARALRIGDQVSWGQRVALDGIKDRSARPGRAGPDGVLRYASVRRLHGFPLTVLVGLAQQEQMAQFEQHRGNYLVAAVGASALLVALVAMISAWSWQLSKARRRERRAQETYAAASEASLDAFFVLRSVTDGRRHHRLPGRTHQQPRRAGDRRRQGSSGRPHDGRPAALLPRQRHVRPAGAGGRRRQGPGDRVAGAQRPGKGPLAAAPDGPGRRRRGGDGARHHGAQAAEERIRHMAHHDELTGLPNRSLIRDRLDEAVRNAQRSGGSWPWPSSTWTASSWSTMASATTPATSCCRWSAAACRPACAAPTPWGAWAATNS
jgi:hypothetical protein